MGERNRRTQMLKPEERVLVEAARLTLSEADAEAFRQTLEHSLDWDRALAMGERVGCLPLLYRHLSQPGWSEVVPPPVQDALAQAYGKAAIRGLRIQGQIQQIRDEAEQRHIPVIFLKGAALSGWLYEDVALRPMTDIDVLVQAADAPWMDRMLRDLGYTQDLSIYKSHVHRKLASRVSHLAPYSRPNRPNVEVHVSLFHHPDMEARLWKKLDAQSHGKKIHRLPLEWMLLHLCVHLEKHLGHSAIVLYWFADIFELIGKCSDSMDWREFERLVDGLGVRQQVQRVMGLLRAWWGMDVPGLGHWHLERFGREDLPLDPHAAKEAFLQNLIPKKRHLFQKVYADQGLLAAGYYGLRIVFPPKRYVLNRCGETSRTRFLGVYLMYSLDRLRNAGAGLWRWGRDRLRDGETERRRDGERMTDDGGRRTEGRGRRRD